MATPLSRTVLAARAVRHKLWAMQSLGTLWPAVVRGGRLLVHGRLREFAGKLLNERGSVVAVDAAPVGGGAPLFLAGHILRPGGYDHVVAALLEGLLAAGVNVHRDPRSVFRYELIRPTARPGESERVAAAPRLIATPPHLVHRFAPDHRSAAFTMWETNALPPSAVVELNRCGLVIVPSRWGADCFRECGVTVLIEVVPLGHDPHTFHPGAASPVADCVFGTAGALDAGGLRKNVQRVIDLFRRAFPAQPDVKLRVKLTPASPPVEAHGDSRIDVIVDSLSPLDLAAWYRSLTAYVNASFGEGFGLHLLEAMACGRPLVSTSFGGSSEFFDATVGYEVPFRLIDARNAVYPTGRWADPDDDAMVSQLRRIHGDRAEASRFGVLAAKRAARFTWAETIRKLVAILRTHGFLHAESPDRGSE